MSVLNTKRRISFKKRRLKKHPYCIYCDKKLNMENATLDHLVPYSLGGKNTFVNISVACAKCNEKRGNEITKKSVRELLKNAGVSNFVI